MAGGTWVECTSFHTGVGVGRPKTAEARAELYRSQPASVGRLGENRVDLERAI